MKNTLLIFMALLALSCKPQSDEITVELKNQERIYHEGMMPGAVALYELDGTLIINNLEGMSHTFTMPDMSKYSEVAYGNEYFTGIDNPVIPRRGYFLVGNYKSDSPEIWADNNCNGDFTDDGGPMVFSSDKDTLYMEFYNSTVKGAKFVYRLGKYSPDLDEHFKAYADYFGNDNPEKGPLTIDYKYWISTMRLNLLTADTEIKGKKVQLGLLDWNCNGTYNDPDTSSNPNISPDRVCVGEYGSEFVSCEYYDGALNVDTLMLMSINGDIWEITDIEPAGKYIKMKPSDKKVDRLYVGSTLPDMTFLTADSTESSFYKEIEEGKYGLIYFWSFGCQGCVMNIPKLNRLDTLRSDSLKIVGLHYEVSPSILKSLCARYNITWTQGIRNEEVAKTLMHGGGVPYAILVGPDRKIIQFGIWSSKVFERFGIIDETEKETNEEPEA